MSVSEGVTGAEIKGCAAPSALDVRGGVKEGEEFELRREVKCLRYKEQQPVGGSRGLRQPGTLLVWASVGLAALRTLLQGCWGSSPGISVEPSCQDGQQGYREA